MGLAPSRPLDLSRDTGREGREAAQGWKSMVDWSVESEDDLSALKRRVGQIVLVFQGGGALGAYQAGVYEALHESGVEPDWIIGTSIGAINAGLIAGAEPAQRVARLKEFWRRVEFNGVMNFVAGLPAVGGALANAATIAAGLDGFFRPNPLAFCGPMMPLETERAGYYSTEPLRATLRELIDFDRANSGAPRLTLGAAAVSTGQMHYFDSRATRLSAAHVLASGALPPAFPAVRVDGELYWDGGILSNTPVESVFDDNPRHNGLVFSVHLWRPHGREPTRMAEVFARHKDIQYSSRVDAHVARQRQLHRLRHVIAELASLLPKDVRQRERTQMLESYGCVTRMHVVRLDASPLEEETWLKDIDFSAAGISARWAAGFADARSVLERRPWLDDFDPLEGFILHDINRDAA
jgi:NTE family protein